METNNIENNTIVGERVSGFMCGKDGEPINDTPLHVSVLVHKLGVKTDMGQYFFDEEGNEYLQY